MACRLSRHELLSNPARAHLYRTIVRQPGIPFLGLLAALRIDPVLAPGAGHGMLMHHLYVLEKFHLILSRKAGRWRRYFQNGGRFGRAVDAIALLQTPPVGLIARAVLENRGASQGELVARLRSEWAGTRQSLAYHLRRLERAGLVRVERRSGRAFHWPTQELGQALSYTGRPRAPVPVSAPIAEPAATVVTAEPFASAPLKAPP